MDAKEDWVSVVRFKYLCCGINMSFISEVKHISFAF